MGRLDPKLEAEYRRLSPGVLGLFPKYRPSVDLFQFHEDVAVLAPFSWKDSRLSEAQVEEAARLCEAGNLYISRADYPLYIRLVIRRLGVLLQDGNLRRSEVSELCLRAMAMRFAAFLEQPVRQPLDALQQDTLVTMELIRRDWRLMGAFLRRPFRRHTPVRHALNVMFVGTWLRMQLAPECSRGEMNRAALGLLLHDIGMLRVPEFMLARPGPLGSDAVEKLLLHPMEGSMMVQKLDVTFEDVALACLEHHERYDGSGYPIGLAGTDISLIGRVAGVADSYCAMITERHYASGLEPRDAAAELAADTQRYDPEMTGILAEMTLSLPELVDVDGILGRGC
jgi:HD-GYP domain-containing protein (c-di-GMP phosphodiesterase class II)